MSRNAPAVSQNPFLAAFRGSFYGVLRWPQLDELWQRLRDDADGGWYIYAVGETPPGTSATAEQLARFIDEVDVLLRREHEEDYCGIVYTDSFDQPTYVKIFDPNNLGVSCGFSDNPPSPAGSCPSSSPRISKRTCPCPAIAAAGGNVCSDRRG
ncbi:uncharacterized protein FOKN1_2773 [Thiohalobacter thiocyanaticus]|uniref:Uncharacterized protein n=1 Tax=Thiohalobacter thiocyanaticus TaxID=585455 RepID=A0A1Z4VUF0_9GAMM|nr:uncharacterized protein FOKN1_2773 [Thiohalobacter thiocyanaticus]